MDVTLDTSERQNKMSRLVFNKGNLDQLKEGLSKLLDVFSELLDVPFEHGNCFSHDDVMARLEAVEQKKWRPIRNMFLKDPFYGYVQGNFVPEEEASPAKILLDVLSVLNQIGEDCQTKMEHYQHVITTLNKEKRDLEAQYYKLEMKESEQRIAFSSNRTEAVTSRSTIEYLEGIMKEKNEKIADLQRQGNVKLWEREKERMLADIKDRMEFLENKNEELKKQNDTLQKKFAVADEQQRKLKMQKEKMAGEVPPQQKKTEEELKRMLYLQEKDLTALDREMLSQQRIFSTILCGIKTDLVIVGENLTDLETGQIPYKDFVKLTSMVEKLCEAMANGDMDSAREELPPHYHYLPSNFKVKRVRRVSNMAKGKLPPIQRAEVNGEAQANGNQSAENTEFVIEEFVENPQLVDPQNDTLNFVNCMKHFSHLSVEFIKEHWFKFKEFDANGDYSLDFAEVVKALSAMGMQFTAQQAEEAMREADVNNSRTLDFFEYILVVDKLIHKSGKSELFHANPRDRKVLAKTCVVQ